LRSAGRDSLVPCCCVISLLHVRRPFRAELLLEAHHPDVSIDFLPVRFIVRTIRRRKLPFSLRPAASAHFPCVRFGVLSVEIRCTL
jgi:hypothetical protein